MNKRVALGLLALGFALTAPGLATAASPFDGTYVGTQRETLSNNTAQCVDLNKDTRLRVTDGVISYRWVVPIETTVGNDGSFSVNQQGQQVGRGGSNQISLKGKITGGQLEADVGSSHCAAHLSLKKT
jgi:hypothetical protein